MTVDEYWIKKELKALNEKLDKLIETVNLLANPVWVIPTSEDPESLPYKLEPGQVVKIPR